MSSREDRIRKEAIELWSQVTQEPAPDMPPSQILEAALRMSGAADYERFHSPWLRREAMIWAVYDSKDPE